jgi:hypothetical protein
MTLIFPDHKIMELKKWGENMIYAKLQIFLFHFLKCLIHCRMNAPVEPDVVEAALNAGNNQIQNEERTIHRKYTTRFT